MERHETVAESLFVSYGITGIRDPFACRGRTSGVTRACRSRSHTAFQLCSIRM